MPFIKVTGRVLAQEKNELEQSYNGNPKVKAAIDQFDSECKLKRELLEARKQNNITQTEL